MVRRRKIIIPVGLICEECGSSDLRGQGSEWRSNPNGDNPPRILMQRWLCKNCGRIFVYGEYKKEG